MRKSIFIFIISLFVCNGLVAQKRIVIDADTGNEMDDLYAIVSALLDDEAEVDALISAHFNNVQLLTDSMWHIYPTEDINTIQISQDLNEQLLYLMDRNNIPHPIGSDRMVGYAWGYYEGAPVPESPGVDHIIHHAQDASPENKLNVVCLGAVTNVAAAVLLEPAIAKNIRLYALTMKYDPKKNAWNKNSFNARNDINGLDVLLNNKDLELIVIPGNISREMVFHRTKTVSKLAEIDHPVAKLLTDRWDEVSAGDTWIMWDLALVEAVIHPGMAKFESVETPPENTSRKIEVITGIDVDAMKGLFWEKLNKLN
jgi:inosine-uridine nucleoside N-ribohydrolase